MRLKSKSVSKNTKRRPVKDALVPTVSTLSDNPLQELINLGGKTSKSQSTGLEFLDNKLDGFDPTGGVGVDIVGMVIDAIENTNLVSPDLHIDDSSCPEAPNVISWLLDDGYLGCEPPYLEQALICLKMFAEYCPHCSDTEWMDIENHEPQEGLGALLEKVVLLEHGVCPECGTHRSDAIANGDLNFYNEMAVLAGQRSGKSIVTAMASTYITHRILKMQRPTEVFNISKSTTLHGTFIALTAGQAKDTLFDPYYGYILMSPWFKKYHALLDHYQRKYHKEIYKLKDTFILYRHRNLTVYPAGPDKRILRGRTRIFGAIDEIGWFDNSKDSKKVKINAEEVYIAMVRSLATIRAHEERLININFDQAMTGYMMNISSPSSIRDKICELVRQSIGSDKTLGIHAPTWKMNPTITRNSRFIQEEYRKDPVTAQRDYGADPPLTANPFIGNSQHVENAFNEKQRNTVLYTSKTQTLGSATYRYAEIRKCKGRTKPSIMALDAGFSNNSFAMVVGGLNGDEVPIIEAIVEVIPAPGIPLSYTMIYEHVMKVLIKEYNVRILLSDRWNSIKILQDAEMEFVDTELTARQYSLKYHDFWAVKIALEQNLFIYPNLEKGQDLESLMKDSLENYPHCFENLPASHFALQTLTVQDSGRTVQKGEGDLTDDIFRAACLFYWGTQQEEFIEIMDNAMNVAEPKRVATGYAVYGSSGGGGANKAVSSSGVTNSGDGKSIGLIQGRK